MKTWSFIACRSSIVAIVLAGATLTARAQPAGAPVTIDGCTVLRWTGPMAHPYWHPFDFPALGPNVPATDGIEIDYSNHGGLPATRVLFVVDYRGDVERIVDAGNFSPNAPIKHTFGNFSGLAYLGPSPNYCRVGAVRFSDGRVWRRQAR